MCLQAGICILYFSLLFKFFFLYTSPMADPLLCERNHFRPCLFLASSFNSQFFCISVCGTFFSILDLYIVFNPHGLIFFILMPIRIFVSHGLSFFQTLSVLPDLCHAVQCLSLYICLLSLLLLQPLSCLSYTLH